MHRLVPSEACPQLDCAESEQIVLNDRCCKVCRGTGDAPTAVFIHARVANLQKQGHPVSDGTLKETNAYAEER